MSTIDILLKQPFAARLDFDALGQGEVRIAYRATDTIWRDIAGDGHGDIALPLPTDWGWGSSYVIDENRYRRQSTPIRGLRF